MPFAAAESWNGQMCAGECKRLALGLLDELE
jgi:hypothetical protein